MKVVTGLLCVATVLGWIVAWSVWPFLAYQANASVPPRRNAVSPPNSDGQITDMHLMAQLGEQAALQVTAKSAAFSESEQRAVVHDIKARIVQVAGQAWNVSAARGLVDRLTGDLSVQGHVRLYEKDGYAIETDRLHLHTAERVLYTDKPVVMHGYAVSIAGTGLRHEIDQNRIVLQHHVKASFQVAGDGRAVKPDTPLGAHVDLNGDRSVGAGAAWREPESGPVTGQ